MPANTAHGYPYPVGTDPVADGDNAIQALAQAVDDFTAMLRFGAGESVVVGAAPPAGTRKIIKQGTSVGNCVAGGQLPLGFIGGAFPNGVSTVIAVPGDSVSGLGFVRLNGTNYTLAGFAVSCFAPGGATLGVGATVRVNWLAIGW